MLYGEVLLIGGIAIMLLWARASGSAAAWATGVACVIGGAFAVFELCAGWCIFRAMGFKTPLVQ